MKLTAILLTVACLQLSASGLSQQRVSLSVKDMTLEQVFSIVKKQTGYLFLYKDESLKDAKPITLSVTNEPVFDVLDRVFERQPLKYIVIGKKTIHIYIDDEKKTAAANLKTPVEYLDSIATLIAGRVLTKESISLEGATVKVKGGKKTVLTDYQGRFSITAKQGDVLSVSYVGYETTNFVVQNISQPALIVMKIAESKLDEVIYTAYGKTSRRLNTGDIAKVSGEDIAKVPVLNPLLALEGRVPGLRISKTSGYPSGPIKTMLRDQLNLNSNVSSEPLFVIDGMPLIVPSTNSALLSTGYDQSNPLYTNTVATGISPLFMIQSLDIESIEILKDADALSIYGAQAANGAILITTKKPKAGPVSVSLNFNKGVKSAVTGTKYLSTPDYLAMRKAAFRNAGLTPTTQSAPELALWDSTRSVNWLKELYGGTGIFDNVALSVSGGQRGLTFRVGGSFSRETEIASAGGSTKRNMLNSALDYTGTGNRFKASIGTSVVYTNVNLRYDTKDFSLPPNAPPIFDSLNNYNWTEWSAGSTNSLTVKFPFQFAGREITTPTSTKVFNVNARLSYSISKQFVFSIDWQKTDNATQSNNFTPIKSKNPAGRIAPTGTASFSSSGGGSFNLTPKLKFDRQMPWGKFSLLMAFAFNKAFSWNTTVSGSGYTNDDLLQTIAGATAVTGNTREVVQQAARFFSIFNYQYLNKYVVNLNISRDGSTKFGPGNKYGTFWSAGAAWIISDEAWVKKTLPSAVSFLKLRGSYGTTGGDGVGDFKYLSQWGPGFPALKPYGGSAGIRSLEAVNPDFHWQTSKKRSLSLDIGLFNDRFNVSITNYADRMGDQLVQFPLAITSGFDFVTANYPALTRNSGWEFVLNTNIIRNESLTWFLSYNLSLNRNKLLAYPGIESSPYKNSLVVGRSLNIVPVLHYTGVDPLTGVATYLDQNNDGTITGGIGFGAANSPDDDRYWLDLTPKFSGGIQSNVRFQNWSLSLNFIYHKATIKDPLYSSISSSGKNIPQLIWDNTWKNPGDQARFPKVTTAPVGINFADTDAGYTDAFYATLGSVSLMRTVYAKLLTKLKIKDASFGVTTNDLFSVALKGYYRPSMVAIGNPLMRTVSFSFNVNF